MKTENNIPAAMLNVFRDLFDARVARYVKCRDMIRHESNLKRTYILSIGIYSLLLIGAVLALYLAPSWKNFGWAVLVLLLAAATLQSFIQRAARLVQEDEESLSFYYRLEKLFVKIWATGRISTVTSSFRLAEELERNLRVTIKFILLIQGCPTENRTDQIAELQSFVKNTIALVVRLELMYTNFITVDSSAELSKEEFFDARARWFYGKLFENPEFKMP